MVLGDEIMRIENLELRIKRELRGERIENLEFRIKRELRELRIKN